MSAMSSRLKADTEKMNVAGDFPHLRGDPHLYTPGTTCPHKGMTSPYMWQHNVLVYSYIKAIYKRLL